MNDATRDRLTSGQPDLAFPFPTQKNTEGDREISGQIKSILFIQPKITITFFQWALQSVQRKTWKTVLRPSIWLLQLGLDWQTCNSCMYINRTTKSQFTIDKLFDTNYTMYGILWYQPEYNVPPRDAHWLISCWLHLVWYHVGLDCFKSLHHQQQGWKMCYPHIYLHIWYNIIRLREWHNAWLISGEWEALQYYVPLLNTLIGMQPLLFNEGLVMPLVWTKPCHLVHVGFDQLRA